jgi:poly(A) polymerase
MNTKLLPAKIERGEHTLSRKQISPRALKVLYRLKDAGYEAYLVGGGVRDLLCERKPKDFDVVTDASPEAIRKVFRNSRIIGRRFRLVHVYHEGEVIEVSTFRASADHLAVQGDDELNPLMLRSNNVYGTIEEDAWRRDFTINALYYNIQDFSIVDYTGGMQDLALRSLKMIGDPTQRYHEDPVRLLRAIRLAAKLDFQIHPETEAPLSQLSYLLLHVASARLYDEFLKLFFEGNAWPTYLRLNQYNYMAMLFPKSWELLQKDSSAQLRKLVDLAVQATDRRFHDGESLNPGFLLAIFLFPALLRWFEERSTPHGKHFSFLHTAFEEVLKSETQILSIPKRITAMIRAIWLLQFYLIRRRKSRVMRIFHHRYFRAAIDLLDLRAQSGEAYQNEVVWWRAFQNASAAEREKMLKSL